VFLGQLSTDLNAAPNCSQGPAYIKGECFDECHYDPNRRRGSVRCDPVYCRGPPQEDGLKAQARYVRFSKAITESRAGEGEERRREDRRRPGPNMPKAADVRQDPEVAIHSGVAGRELESPGGLPTIACLHWRCLLSGQRSYEQRALRP